MILAYAWNAGSEIKTMNVAEVTATVGFLFDYWNRDNSTIMYSKLKAVKSVLTDM